MYVSERKEDIPVTRHSTISILQGTAIIVGMVIGPGIFKTPSIVASTSGSESITLLLWLAGGIISFIGALCYAELTSSFPHTGGEYHYLGKSFGKKTAFLFAWGRMTIIQTGSIAMLSFIIGDYASETFNIGPYSSPIFASISVIILTAINIRGIHPSSKIQVIMFAGIIVGLGIVILTGLFQSSPGVNQETAPNSEMVIGHAMIFVLLTYGGWNEAAYLSTEIGHKPLDITKVLFYSIGLITFIYLVMNFSLLKGLGLEGLSKSEAVVTDLVSLTLGENGAKFIGLLVVIAAFSTVNAVMITGARTNFALGQDFHPFKFLSKWNDRAPVNSYLFQAAISLILIFFGSLTRNGFVTMVEFTSPVFWLFFLLVGISVMILRVKEPDRKRPFRVPLFPIVPLLFCASAGFMLHSSLVYTGIGAIVGVAVLLTGIPFLFIKKKTEFSTGGSVMNKFRTVYILLVIFSLQIQISAQDVPYVPTTPEVVKGMLELANVTKNDIVYDLGCGDGRIVIAAARDFGATGFGVDSNPKRIEESNENAKINKVEEKVTFEVQNLFETELKDASVVTLYLLSSVNLKLRPKLFQELKPGTRIVSHAFTMEDWDPDEHRQVDNRDIYLWIIPENFSGTWSDNFDKNLSLKINQLFQKISGTFHIGENKYDITNAAINGKTLTFSASERGADLKFEGELVDDQLTGTIISADNKLNQKFTGVRQEGTMKPLDPNIMSATE